MPASDIRNDWIQSPLDLTTAFGSGSSAVTIAASVAAITGAGSASQYNVAKRITITCGASSASTLAPAQYALYNSSNSAGTILASWTILPQNATAASGVAGPFFLDFDELYIPTPTAAQAMCVSSVGASVAGVLVNVNLQTFILGKQPAKVTFVS
jgi:hypothetical protein